MQAFCKRYTDIPHTSRLFGDLLYHFDRVQHLYPHNPLDPQSYRNAAAAIQFPADRRAALIAALKQQNPAHPHLERLSNPNTVAVVTGQQVGLYSGPSYTIYKALTAVKLAQQLTDSGLDAVPIFWLATEDHDLAEVSTCWTYTAQNQPVPLHLSIPSDSTRPVGNLEMRDLPNATLANSLQPFPHGEEIAATVTAAYRPGCHYGEAFVALLRDLLSTYGLLFFDPMHPASRKLAAPFLAQAAAAAPDLTASLLQRNNELTAGGYHAQVHIEDHTSLFFLLDNGERIALRRDNGAYYHRDRRFTTAELQDRAESLSPNATLRPVVQDYMIPTVAYIGGPAELAYLAQSAVIYKNLLGRMPVSVPRSGFTIIDAHSRKLMERYRLHLDSCFPGEDHLKQEIAARLVPAEVAASFQKSSQGVNSHLAALRHALQPFDSTLAKALDKSTAKMRYQLEKMERKITRESLRRDTRAQQDAAYLYNLLFPHKHLQERFYTILPFLAQHGPHLLDTLYDNIRLDCPDHHILYL
ncbi:MAG: bacillithiol biosynthesis cysteine-adding enzyme BshC [Acidobacteria bacterium]|nr:bacillithiol biosynthesis cysteine-adding enzyme BshC [Acidobacteriota bacterium]